MKTSHILILAEWYPVPHDIQLGIFIHKMAIASAKTGFKITLCHVYGSEKSEKVTIREQNGLTIVQAAYQIRKSKLINFLSYRKKYREALRTIAKPDLIHLQVCGKNALMMRQFYPHVPFVITEHWSGYLRGKTALTRETFIRTCFKNANGISAVSHLLANRLAELFGRDDIKVIPNIVEYSNLSLRKPSKPTVLFVGDMVDAIKNISGIIEAAEIAAEKHSFELILIGDGPDLPMLRQKTEAVRNKNVQFVFQGRKSNREVLQQMASSGFLVLNSQFETFGLVCAEAIMSGIPVVCSRCGGPEEFITAENGILVNKNNPKELAEGMLKMLDGTFSSNEENIKNSLQNKFSEESAIQQLKHFYEDAFKNSGKHV